MKSSHCLSETLTPSAFLSSMYLTAAFAANLPSVKDPDENLWALPPTVSPAPNKPSIVKHSVITPEIFWW